MKFFVIFPNAYQEFTDDSLKAKIILMLQGLLIKPTKWIEQLGAVIIDALSGLGRFVDYSMKFFYWLLKPPFRLRLIFEQLYFIGNKSLFIIFLAGSFTGMVMAIKLISVFNLFLLIALSGSVTAISLSKELAPVLSGLIVAGRAGAAMATDWNHESDRTS